MQEIKCPHCGKLFQIDESEYAKLVSQIRDQEFEKEISKREKALKEQIAAEQKAHDLELEKEHTEAITAKNAEIAQRDATIREYKEKLKGAASEKKLDVQEAEQKKEKIITEKDVEIASLKAQLKQAEVEQELAITKATKEKDQEIADRDASIQKLKDSMDLQQANEKLEKEQREKLHQEELRMKDDEITRLKDFKAKLSTKMVGESLEQHCLTEFNKVRMMAFPNAVFEKDNDIKTGSKGDFIFRESEGETEFLSIMFEMKNESDTTATKHKNEDFFKELDKDRKEKHCEYAVLVSMLEADSDLYNTGIVDVSYRYPKMYVIRPQFFIQFISLLRNAALQSLEYQKKLKEVLSQQTDLTNFEEQLEQFKTGFADSFRKAGERYTDAINGIDAAISTLEKIRDNLRKSEKHLDVASRKLEDVSIKKLTKDAPSVREMFEEVKASRKALQDGEPDES